MFSLKNRFLRSKSAYLKYIFGRVTCLGIHFKVVLFKQFKNLLVIFADLYIDYIPKSSFKSLLDQPSNAIKFHFNFFGPENKVKFDCEDHRNDWLVKYNNKALTEKCVHH